MKLFEYISFLVVVDMHRQHWCFKLQTDVSNTQTEHLKNCNAHVIFSPPLTKHHSHVAFLHAGPQQ